jgi:hypothetical protein
MEKSVVLANCITLYTLVVLLVKLGEKQIISSVNAYIMILIVKWTKLNKVIESNQRPKMKDHEGLSTCKTFIMLSDIAKTFGG